VSTLELQQRSRLLRDCPLAVTWKPRVCRKGASAVTAAALAEARQMAALPRVRALRVESEGSAEWVRTWAVPPLLASLQKLSVPAEVAIDAAPDLLPALSAHAPLLHTLILASLKGFTSAALEFGPSTPLLFDVCSLPAVTSLRLAGCVCGAAPVLGCSGQLQRLDLAEQSVPQLVAFLRRANLQSLRVLVLRHSSDDASFMFGPEGDIPVADAWALLLSQPHLHTLRVLGPYHLSTEPLPLMSELGRQPHAALRQLLLVLPYRRMRNAAKRYNLTSHHLHNSLVLHPLLHFSLYISGPEVDEHANFRAEAAALATAMRSELSAAQAVDFELCTLSGREWVDRMRNGTWDA